VVGHRSRQGCTGCHHSTQRLDDAPGRDVPGATVDGVGLLAVLVVTGLRVGMAVDDLGRPLGIPELHLLLVIALTGDVLLAFPLAGRRSITVGLLLLLLAEWLHELLGVVVPGVVHRARRTTLITTRGLAWSLLAAWGPTPAAAAIVVAVGVPTSGMLL
jgi:hypothetical protein